MKPPNKDEENPSLHTKLRNDEEPLTKRRQCLAIVTYKAKVK